MARKYDPVKAHEYYMRTRKLKGRKKKKSDPRMSQKGFSQAQKEMAAYVKEKLRKKLKDHRVFLADKRKREKEKLREQLKRDIASLRDRVGKVEKGSPEAESLKRQIKKIRSIHKSASARISDNYKAEYAKAKAANKEELAQEMDKIRSGTQDK